MSLIERAIGMEFVVANEGTVESACEKDIKCSVA
jgi:hypothetical protein